MEIDLADTFKSLGWDLMIRVAVADLLAALSLTPQGFLGVVITTIVVYFTNKLYPYLVKLFRIGEIKFQNEIHQKAYETAQYKLKVVAIESGINSDAFKKEREIEHEKLAKLVVFNDGSTVMRIGNDT